MFVFPVCAIIVSNSLPVSLPLLRPSNQHNTQSHAKPKILYAVKCWFKNQMSKFWTKLQSFKTVWYTLASQRIISTCRSIKKMWNHCRYVLHHPHAHASLCVCTRQTTPSPIHKKTPHSASERTNLHGLTLVFKTLIQKITQNKHRLVLHSQMGWFWDDLSVCSCKLYMFDSVQLKK